VIVVREDPTSRLEDVIRKVHEEGDVARAERVIGEERVEVGTRDDLDRAAGVVKVGDHRGSVDNLIVGQVDIPAMSPALAGEMRRMTGTGCVGSSPRVECDVVDEWEDALSRDGGNPSPPTPSGSMMVES